MIAVFTSAKAYLARSTRLSALISLDLSGNHIGAAGVQALARSQHLGRLRSLDLSCNDIGESGVRELVASSQLNNLSHLALSADGIGKTGKRLVEERFGPDICCFRNWKDEFKGD
jgi:hypothetical protein